ncbi:MAG: phenylalanine--tRNA ligase subunit beta [bacterium]|nr:phenylalanine--tRNA ligase subunit beta [bacterium]
MKISYNWLKEYVDLPVNPEEIARLLTEHSYEASVVGNGPLVDLKRIVVGEVVETAKHPNADRLSLTRTKVGNKVYEIICGASNVRTGLKVAVAFPGVQVLDKEGNLATLEKAVIRGIASEGMLCSERELGLGDSHSGIMELPVETKNGLTLDKLFAPNVVLDIDLLPDRAPDSSSYFGVAREVGALLQKKTKLPKVSLKLSKKNSSAIKLNIENKNHCLRYIAMEIDGIKNGPSPEWLQDDLRSQGIKPQNLIVDVTNFVLWELGQPTHAFDATAINGQIGVRQSKAGEKLVTLDDVERVLPKGTLIITSNDLPVAIAGVMGGKASAVKPDTSKIVLEAAIFAQPIIRQFVNKTNVRTDASDRFTRGLTLDHAAAGANRVIELLVKYGGGKVVAQQEFSVKQEKTKSVTVTHQQIEDVLGTKVKPSEVISILKRLQFSVSEKAKKYVVKAPLFRRDIEIPEDVIEEVGRVLGYNNLPSRLPEAPLTPTQLPQLAKDIRVLQNVLRGAGFLEAYFYSVVKDNIANILEVNVDESLVVVNPLRSDEKLLRQSLLPNILGASENIVKKELLTRIFEIGHVYAKDSSEKSFLAGAIVRRGTAETQDFFELKGIVEYLLEQLDLPEITFKPLASWNLGTAGASISVGKTVVGAIGLIDQEILGKLKVRGGIVAFEIDLSLVEKLQREQTTYNPPLPYPTVERDITLVFPEQVLVDAVQTMIMTAGGKNVQDVDFVDQYDDEKQRSVTLRILYGSSEKTLTDGEVNSLQKNILSELAEKLGVKEKG